MTKRIRQYSIFSLFCVFVITLLTAVCLIFGVFMVDAERSITLTGNNYFYASDEAEIKGYNTGTDDEGNNVYYTSFVFSGDDASVTYRKNLAYHWISSVESRDAGGDFLSTEIGFTDLNFTSFTIKFQSQQYTLTKDGVTSNYITFVAGTNCVYAVIGKEIDDTEISAIAKGDEEYVALSYSELTISFGENDESGVYSVVVSDGVNSQEGSFTNIGGNYSEYISATSGTSVVPLTYSAQLAGEESVTMVLYSFNGQSFQVQDEDDCTVTDDTPPVLCLAQDVTVLDYGSELDVDYVVIDMLTTSPRATLSYYVLTETQAESGNDLDDPENGYFYDASSTDLTPVIKVNGAYVPDDGSADGEDYTTVCLVKAYYTLSDSATSGGESTIVYLDWYVDDSYLTEVGGSYFIRAADDKTGAYYAVAEDSEANTYDTEKTEAYQDAVDKVAEDATAADGNYLYLPSFEECINDNITSYTDMTFSIYYYSSELGSYTGLAYNELSIELTAYGNYKFAIYATDVAGNEMYYWYEGDDGWIKVTFEAEDLEDLLSDPESSKLYGYVPIFTFSVRYAGLTVEDAEAQNIGYVGVEYEFADFEISGLSSQYNAEYTLYLFDREAYTADKGALTYAEFLEIVEELYNEADDFASYFSIILTEDDEHDVFGDYSDYEWDSSALTFIPQDDNAFYVLKIEVTDIVYKTEAVVKFMAISVSAEAESMYGEDTWAQDNVASIVLLCIAGLSLVGIILLLVIKPMERDDIDVIDEKETSSEKKKSKKDKTA